MSYALSIKAEEDLIAIFIWGVEQFGFEQALNYRTALERTFELLAQHPRIARLRDTIIPPIRAYPHRPYLILYDILEDETVLIQRLRHGREDWQSNPV